MKETMAGEEEKRDEKERRNVAEDFVVFGCRARKRLKAEPFLLKLA